MYSPVRKHFDCRIKGSHRHQKCQEGYKRRVQPREALVKCDRPDNRIQNPITPTHLRRLRDRAIIIAMLEPRLDPALPNLDTFYKIISLLPRFRSRKPGFPP